MRQSLPELWQTKKQWSYLILKVFIHNLADSYSLAQPHQRRHISFSATGGDAPWRFQSQGENDTLCLAKLCSAPPFLPSVPPLLRPYNNCSLWGTDFTHQSILSERDLSTEKQVFQGQSKWTHGTHMNHGEF
jgi:hypothetical protein